MSGLKKQAREIFIIAALAGIVYAAFCAAPVAVAQGSRKDDIVFNAQGRPMAGATVRVCTSAATGQPCSPLAQIYSDPGLTQALANPTATDGMGNYTFYAAPGRYEIEISGPNITTKQLPNVILPSDPTSPTFTTLTTTSGISAFSLSLTGNLTVTGSAAVTGSLSVGGAPVPSTGQENQWSASQHFKGPIPWRDVTAYMKDANGNLVNCSTTSTDAGANTTGSMSASSATLTLAAAKDFKNGCGIKVFGAGAASTIGTPTGLSGYAHGFTGSTTDIYEVVAFDQNEGYSVASSSFSITTANATLSKFNYNAIWWNLGLSGAYMYAVYANRNGAGFVCIGTAFETGYQDYGFNFPCPVNAPATPPASRGADSLYTTIVSGGGTTSLTLAASATTAVSSVGVYHDESTFFKSCATDANTDQGNSASGSYGCFVPAGNYWINGPMPTDTVTPTGGQTIRLMVSGQLTFHSLPWFCTKPGYSIQGQGGGAVSGGGLPLGVSSTLPAAFVAYATCPISGFSINGISGPGIFEGGGDVLGGGVSPPAVYISGMNIVVSSGAPGIEVETAINGSMGGISVNGGISGGLASILFNGSGYDSAPVCCIAINGLFTSIHGIEFQQPAGNGSGAAFNTFTIRDWQQENQDPLDLGMIINDAQGAPGTTNAAGSPVLHMTLDNISNADIGAQYNNLLVPVGSLSQFQYVSLNHVQTSAVIACFPVWISPAPNCGSYTGSSTIVGFSSVNGPSQFASNVLQNGASTAGPDQIGLWQTPNATFIKGPLVLTDETTNGSFAQQAWKMALPAPYSYTSTVSSGGLAAGNYCMGIVGVDILGNETDLPAVECYPISGNQSIVENWNSGIGGGNLNYAYNSETFYYCVTASTSCTPDHKITGVGGSGGSGSYTFTSTAGAVTGTPNTVSQAKMSWLSWDEGLSNYSCFFCVGSHSDEWPIGFGVLPTPNAGFNIYTALGVHVGNALTVAAGPVDFSAGASLTIPHAAGLAPTGPAQIGFDDTAGQFWGQYGSTTTGAKLNLASAVTQDLGYIPTWTASHGFTTLTDLAPLGGTVSGGASPIFGTCPGGLQQLDVFGVNASGVLTCEFLALPEAGHATGYTFAATDRGQWAVANSASAVAWTLPDPSTTNFGAGWYFTAINENSGLLTISRGTSATFPNGATTFTVPQNDSCLFSNDGTNWWPVCSDGKLVAGTGISITANADSSQTISTYPANVTTTVGTTAIGANTCAAAVAVTMTGLTTSMTLTFTPTSDTSAVTGWGSTGGLVITAWPTANTVNYHVCNQTGSSITPGGSVTFNVSAK